MARLEGKTALVVGAGSGIGRAGAELLAREGASVVCADVNSAGVSATVDSITRAGGRASTFVADVSELSAAQALAQAPFNAFGALDVLIYSAGTSATASILEHTRAEWDRVISVNLTGAFMLGQAVAQRMVTQGRSGSIVFVTTQLAQVAVREKSAYLASKGGLRSLMMGMALDLAPHGVRVNAVAPGPVLTELTKQRFADPMIRQWTIDHIPAGRLGESEDIAGAIAFLASDGSRWVVGTTIVVDGGYLAE